MRMEPSGFWVADNNSKFGTLVRVCDSLSLDDYNGLQGHAIQMGRTIFSISYDKSFNFARMLAQLKKNPESKNPDLNKSIERVEENAK